MEFCLERFAIFKTNNYLPCRETGLFPYRPLSIAIAGFPHYALQTEGFSAMMGEVRFHPKNFYSRIEDWLDLQDFPNDSTDLLIAHRHFFYSLDDENVNKFFQETNRILRPDGLVFAFHKTCLLEGKERWMRAIKHKLGWQHHYRRSSSQFKRLASPLITILDAEVEDGSSYASDRFALSVLVKDTTRFEEYKDLPLVFTLESYNPDYWNQRRQPVLINK